MKKDIDDQEEIGNESSPGILGRVEAAASAAKQGVRRSAEVMSGADMRRFEDFTEAAATAVIGVHRDQTELRERLTHLEQSVKDLQQGQATLLENLTRMEHFIRAQIEPEQSRVGSPSPWVIAFGAVSIVALLLSIVAVLAGTL